MAWDGPERLAGRPGRRMRDPRHASPLAAAPLGLRQWFEGEPALVSQRNRDANNSPSVFGRGHSAPPAAQRYGVGPGHCRPPRRAHERLYQRARLML